MSHVYFVDVDGECCGVCDRVVCEYVHFVVIVL